MNRKNLVAAVLISVMLAINSQAQTETAHPALLAPSLATEKAPEKFSVKFATTKGEFVAEVNRAWSPNGADRFYNLVKIGYFKETVIFRAIEGFMFQFGIHSDPQVNAEWTNSNIKDDPGMKGISNTAGYITYAKDMTPNSRSVQFFVNLDDNAALDGDGFTPFAKVTKGMEVVKKINTEYGENQQGDQDGFQKGGAKFILGKYPNLDTIQSVTLIPMAKAEGSGSQSR